jgi:2-dehydro-3-deoxygalactonokinase
MNNVFVAVDWGTTSLRAYAVDARGAVVGSINIEGGVQSKQHSFERTLADALAALPGCADLPVLMAGMIGSRQGWIEAPYVEAPCDVHTLGQRLTDVPTSLGRLVKIVPGVADLTRGVPDVMRGEETQLLGLLQDHGDSRLACMPGTHCKWVNLASETIVGLRTYMSGEAFKLFAQHSILSRLMMPNSEGDDWYAFEAGLERAAQPGHFLHHLFGVRTQGLFGNLRASQLESYLSGIVIGHEVLAARAIESIDGPVVLVGDGKLTARYERALARVGIAYTIAPEDIVVRGLTRIAQVVGWLDPAAAIDGAAAHATSQSYNASSYTKRNR